MMSRLVGARRRNFCTLKLQDLSAVDRHKHSVDMSSLIQTLRKKLLTESESFEKKREPEPILSIRSSKAFNPELPATAFDTSAPLPEDHHHLLHDTRLPISLQDFIISPSNYSKAFYVPHSISPLHEVALLSAIDDISHKHVWVELRARRLQQWASPLPPFLERLATDLVSLGIFPESFKPNHMLINSYEPDEGIAAHTDGPSYFPTVATLSLGDDCVMRYSVLHGREKMNERGGQIIGEVILERRSLIITTDVLYTDYAHSIQEKEDVVSVSREMLWKWKVDNDNDDNVLGDYQIKRQERRVSVTMRHKFIKE